MAGGVGKLEAEIEVKSNADKLWSAIKDYATIFPRALPSESKSIHIIEGDGKLPGSLFKITLDIERIEGVDDAKRTLIYRVIDGEILKYLKSYKGYFSVIPKVDDNGGSIVKWSCH
ncbi:hypothetical protein PIB30_065630 [Stylosanthes scabra]|uniref:Bet v I/Major latex protein domain-containing protein n=1 Tax=Stylosanthes scabra TaxID=79078 RepID=A0ABU6YMU4_9FABA|nr:hypothetical protein [Stylosanthes scabra]